MKLKLCAAAAALITSAVVSAATAALDGRGVICLNDDGDSNRHFVWSKNDWLFYRFTAQEISAVGFYEGEEGLVITPGLLGTEYRATAEKITWEYGPYPGSAHYIIDRRTGLLTKGNESGRVVDDWICELYATPEAFEAGVEKVLKDENEARDAYMSKNKI